MFYPLSCVTCQRRFDVRESELQKYSKNNPYKCKGCVNAQLLVEKKNFQKAKMIALLETPSYLEA